MRSTPPLRARWTRCGPRWTGSGRSRPSRGTPPLRCACGWRCTAEWWRSAMATILACRSAASRACSLPAMAARSCSRRPPRSWLREQLVPELTLRHLGRYRLKDLTDPQHIFQLVAADLPADFPPLRLSGERDFDEPPLILPPFLSAAPPPPGPAAPFVAREQELAELAAALTTARSGAGQILFIIGEAGRGKTMLVQEFARQAQAADAELLVVSGSSNAHTGTGDPYLPFREALTMLSGEVEANVGWWADQHCACSPSVGGHAADAAGADRACPRLGRHLCAEQRRARASRDLCHPRCALVESARGARQRRGGRQGRAAADRCPIQCCSERNCQGAAARAHPRRPALGGFGLQRPAVSPQSRGRSKPDADPRHLPPRRGGRESRRDPTSAGRHPERAEAPARRYLAGLRRAGCGGRAPLCGGVPGHTAQSARRRVSRGVVRSDRGTRLVYRGVGAGSAGTQSGAAIEPGAGQTASAGHGTHPGLARVAAPVTLSLPASAVPAVCLSQPDRDGAGLSTRGGRQRPRSDLRRADRAHRGAVGAPL